MQRFNLTTVSALVALTLAGAAHAAPIKADRAEDAPRLAIFNGGKAAGPQAVLKANAARFGLPANLSNLSLVQVQESLLGKHYRYQQSLHGVVVDGAEAIVSMGHDGGVLKVFNATKPVSASLSAAAAAQLKVARIGSEVALDSAWSNMKVQHPLLAQPTAKLVFLASGGELRLSYKVQIDAQMPTGGFVQFIDANSGELLKAETTTLVRKGEPRTLESRASVQGATLNRKAASAGFAQLNKQQSTVVGPQLLASGINGTGNTFDPDPRTTLNSDALTDTSSASAFDAAYQVKSLRDLTVTSGVYSLTGPYVRIKNLESPNTAPSTSTTGVWTAKRGSNAFNDSNTYFHIDQNQRYLQALGFTGTKGIMANGIDVDTDGENGADNSHYMPGSPGNLVFGHGCVDDNEDADVILHEYGHAIHHNINTSWSGGDTGAMGEGFGDYWAGSYSYSTPNGQSYHPEWAFSWDGHGACWGGRVMNKTTAKYNSSKTYGAHVNVTEGGVTFQSDELWSTPLFQALTALVAAGKPRDNVDKIIIEAHFGLGSGVKMPVMAQAIVDAATRLFPTDATYADTFKAKFVAQNILTGTTPPPPPPPTGLFEVESNNTASTANTLTVNGGVYSATIGSTTDVDWYKVTLGAGKTLAATLTPNATSDYDLAIYSSNGTTKLASSVKGTGLVDSASVKNTGTTSSVRYVKITRYSGATGTGGTYTLKATF